MRHLIPILFISLGLYSCKTNVYSTARKCISKEQLNVLHRGVELFESKLSEEYHDSTIEESYFLFLNDLSDKNLSIDFFRDSDSDSIHHKIRDLKIWDISNRSEENMVREARLFNVVAMSPYRTKLNEEISKCLIPTTNSLGISAFLLMNSEYRLSPKRITKVLFRQTSEAHLKNYNNRIAIVLGVYYQTAFNIIP